MIDAFKKIEQITTICGIKKDVLLRTLNESSYENLKVKQVIEGAILIHDSSKGENILLRCVKYEIEDINKSDYSCALSTCTDCYIKYLNK